MKSKLSGFVIELNKPDINGRIINANTINLDDFEKLKINGNIIDYEMSNDGIKIIKMFDLKSVSI